MAENLRGKRVLIVEDEYFIAAGLRDALRKAEMEVVGPVGGIEQAMRLADTPIDMALLDVDLGGAMSFEVADRLTDRAVPFLFVTGYDGWALPDAYRDIPRVAKPFDEADILSRMGEMIATGAAS